MRWIPSVKLKEKLLRHLKKTNAHCGTTNARCPRTNVLLRDSLRGLMKFQSGTLLKLKSSIRTESPNQK